MFQDDSGVIWAEKISDCVRYYKHTDQRVDSMGSGYLNEARM